MATKIPKLSTKATIQTDVRVAAPSVESAGLVSRATQQLAKQIRDTSVQIGNRVIQAKRSDYLDTQNAELFTEVNEIITQEKLASGPDFDGLADRVNNRMQESVNRRVQLAPDSRSGDMFKSSSLSFLARNQASTIMFQEQEADKFRTGNISTSSKNMGFHFLNNPNVEEGLLTMQERDQSISLRDDLSEKQRKILRDESQLQITQGNVQGFVELGEFSLARQMVDGDYGGVFSKNPELARKTKDFINRSQRESLNRKFVGEERDRKQDKRNFEQQEEDTVRAILTKSIQGVDPSKDLADAVRDRKIDTTTYRIIRSELANDVEREKSNISKFRYTLRISNGEDIETIKKDLVRDVLAGNVDDKTGLELLNTIDTARKAGGRDNPRVKAGNTLLKSAFVARFGFAKGEEMRQLSEAMIFRDELITQGRDPVEAARAAIKRFKGDLNSLPLIPGVGFNEQTRENLFDSQKIAIKLNTMRQKGQITIRELKERLLLLKQRKQAIEANGFKSAEELNGSTQR